MSFIKATAKGGEYERDVNATDAALEKGGNRKDLFSIHTLHTSLYLWAKITICFIEQIINLSMIVSVRLLLIANYRFDAVNWAE